MSDFYNIQLSYKTVDPLRRLEPDDVIKQDLGVQKTELVKASGFGQADESGSEKWAHFAQGLYHGIVEDPVNGVVQLINRSAGSHVPELHLVDEDQVKNSPAGRMGSDLGTGADVLAAALLTSKLTYSKVNEFGSATIGALKMGAIGGAYSSIFTPTNPESKNFLQDRLVNGLIGFSAYGGLALGLGYPNSRFSSLAAGTSMGGALMFDIQKSISTGDKID